MNLNYDLINGGALLIAQPPVSIAAAAVNGSYANMAYTPKLGILLTFAAGTADEEPEITLTQATSSAGAGAKSLAIESVKYILAADLKASQAWTVYSAVDRQNTVTTLDTVVFGAGGTNQLAVFIEVDAAMMDTTNGFTHLRCNVADTGAGARFMTIHYIALEKCYQGEATPGLLS
jgi:hypothetical protein